jgi:hypothetical protein
MVKVPKLGRGARHKRRVNIEQEATTKLGLGHTDKVKLAIVIVRL